MAAIISGKLVKLGAGQNALGGTELLAERLSKYKRKDLKKILPSKSLKIQDIFS